MTKMKKRKNSFCIWDSLTWCISFVWNWLLKLKSVYVMKPIKCLLLDTWLFIFLLLCFVFCSIVSLYYVWNVLTGCWRNNDFIISFRSSSSLHLFYITNLLFSSYSMSQCLWSSKILSSFIVVIFHDDLFPFIYHKERMWMGVWMRDINSQIERLLWTLQMWADDDGSRVVDNFFFSGGWKEENEKFPITRT